MRTLLESDQGVASGLLCARLAERAHTDSTVVGVEWREALEALIALLGAIARVRGAARAAGVIVEPSTVPGAATALFVWHGRVVCSELVGPGRWDVAVAALSGLQRASDQPVPPLARGELEPALILHEWLRSRADHPGVVPLVQGFDPAAALEALRRAVAAMSIFQPDPAVSVDGGGFATAA